MGEEDSAFVNRNAAPKTSSSSMNSLPSLGNYMPAYPPQYQSYTTRTPQYQSNYPPYYPPFLIPPHGFPHYQDDQNMATRENPRSSARAPPGFLPQHQRTPSGVSVGYDAKSSHHRSKAAVAGNDKTMQDDDWDSSARANQISANSNIASR